MLQSNNPEAIQYILDPKSLEREILYVHERIDRLTKALKRLTEAVEWLGEHTKIEK